MQKPHLGIAAIYDILEVIIMVHMSPMEVVALQLLTHRIVTASFAISRLPSGSARAMCLPKAPRRALYKGLKGMASYKHKASIRIVGLRKPHDERDERRPSVEKRNHSL